MCMCVRTWTPVSFLKGAGLRLSTAGLGKLKPEAVMPYASTLTSPLPRLMRKLKGVGNQIHG